MIPLTMHRRSGCWMVVLAACTLALQASGASAHQAGAKQSLPMYGNWCGPKYGSGTPVDAVDGCCKAHDQCYVDKWYFNCDCDASLRACMQQVRLPYGQQFDKARMFKAVAAMYYRNAPCKMEPPPPSPGVRKWLSGLRAPQLPQLPKLG